MKRKLLISCFILSLSSSVLLHYGGSDNSDSNPDTGGDPADTTPPTVISVSPANGTAGIALDRTITATFSESMYAGNNFLFTLLIKQIIII